MDLQTLPTITKAPSMRDRQRALREETILDCAQAMLTQNGYGNVTIDEIAAVVGISKQTFYTHFSSKEQLCVSILLRDIEEGKEKFDRLMESHTPLEALRIIIGMSLESHYGSATLFGYAAGTALFSDERILTAERGLASRIAAVFAAGQKDGTIRSDLHPMLMAQTFHSILKDVAHEPATRSVGLDCNAVHDQLVTLFSR